MLGICNFERNTLWKWEACPKQIYIKNIINTNNKQVFFLHMHLFSLFLFQFWYIAIKTLSVSLILIRKIALKLNHIVGNEGVKKRVDQQLKLRKIGSSSFAKGTKRI